MGPQGVRDIGLTLAETPVICRASGGLWLGLSRTLVVADMHLEKGSAYAARGQLLPPYDTIETLARLESEVAQLDPARIVLLGDSFHDADAGARLSTATLDRISAMAALRRMIWVRGNHDAALPAGLPGDQTDQLCLEGLSLVHEPARQDCPQGEVSGHLHPCARVKGRGGSVRRRCFVNDDQRLILPAFGAYAGGLNVRDPAIAGLLRGVPMVTVLGLHRVHAVGWASLRGD